MRLLIYGIEIEYLCLVILRFFSLLNLVIDVYLINS
jgi:hypothetical protein